MNIVSLLITKHNATRMTATGEAPFWRERGAEYVRKFFAGVRRHTTQPVRLWLLTDTPEAAPSDVTVIPTRLNTRASPGWWSKLGIFMPGIFPRGEKVFYSDLDNVISGPLDPLLELEPTPLVMMHDTPNQFPGRWGQGSTLLFRADELGFLWDEYVRNPAAIMREYWRWPRASDQAYIQERVEKLRGAPVQLFQEELPRVKFLNSRWQLEKGASWRDCSFVYGCYIPKPHQSTHPFYVEHWRE